MAGHAQDLLSGLDRTLGVHAPRESGYVDAGRLVSNQLVYQGIGPDQYTSHGIVKPVYELAEIGGTHALRQGSRAPHVGKEQGEFDLGPALVLGGEVVADVADEWVELGRALVVGQLHQGCADPVEGGVAEPATGIGRQAGEEVPVAELLRRVSPRQERAPGILHHSLVLGA